MTGPELWLQPIGGSRRSKGTGKAGDWTPVGRSPGRIRREESTRVFLPEEAPLVTHSLAPEPHRDGLPNCRDPGLTELGRQ